MILRRESFGGIVFHPEDGTTLEIDHEAFDSLVVCTKGEATEAQRNFVRTLESHLPAQKTAKRIVKNAIEQGSIPGVLSAPTLVDFQITTRCTMNCPQCYAAASPAGKDVSWKDACHALDEMCRVGVCQVAIGGGEPLAHPRVIDILRYARDSGMVPNVSTSGLSMTKSQRHALARLCGAVAVSLEGVDHDFSLRRAQGFEAFRRVVGELLDAGARVVFQVTLSAENFGAVERIVEFCLTVTPLYGVIFLAYKSAGRGSNFDAPLSTLPVVDVRAKLLTVIQPLMSHTRVGFDCCMSPMLATLEGPLGFAHGAIVEGCSALRGSCGLTPDLDVVPCTFLTRKTIGNLRAKGLDEIWRSRRSHEFRATMKRKFESEEQCVACVAGQQCLGGCPEWRVVDCLME